MSSANRTQTTTERPSLLLSEGASLWNRIRSTIGQGFLLLVTLSSVFGVLFIFIFILKDAIPFFRLEGFREFFTSTEWYPTGSPPVFGALAIFYGSFMVTIGAILLAVPLGVAAAICLSEILPFSIRQMAKPVIEILAAIPSVAYGFFALVVFAPLLQEHGGAVLAGGAWVIGFPFAALACLILSDFFSARFSERKRKAARLVSGVVVAGICLVALYMLGDSLSSIKVVSGTNALNVSIILGIMALPTVVSVSEDSLQAVGRELREGSYALGATRAETILKVLLPAASSGILAAVILGVMRAVGETMVVWMASGNSAQIPEPFYNFLEPVRTLTATIAGDMGEADQTTGSSRYHVLFAMALSLLTISLICNLISERAVAHATRRARGK